MRSFKKWLINLRISESEIRAATIFKNSEGNSSSQPGLRTDGITTLALPIMFNMFNVKMYIIPDMYYIDLYIHRKIRLNFLTFACMTFTIIYYDKANG